MDDNVAMNKSYLENLRILVIDDNSFTRDTIVGLLSHLGAKDVAEASDGTDGYDVMKSFRPDIIFVDWDMAPMNGLEFTRTARNADDTPDPYVPIIMISGHSDEERITIARNAGVNEFVTKPFTAKMMLSRINDVIENPRRFVQLDDYLGPDRRLQSDGISPDQERRTVNGNDD